MKIFYINIQDITLENGNTFYELLDNRGIPVSSVSEYLKSLYFVKNSKSTSIRNSALCLKQYFEYFEFNGLNYFDTDLDTLIKFSEYLNNHYKNSNSFSTILSYEDMSIALKYVSNIRDKLLLTLLFQTGLRVSDIINIHTYDFICSENNYYIR